jgi:hypothetical protein
MNSTRSAVRLHRNPQLAPGLSALAAFLIDQHYSSHAIGRIEAYVATHGTLAGSMIEPEDEAGAEEAFVSALPELPADSEAWDRDTGVIFCTEWLADGSHPFPIPVIGDDDRTIPPDADLLPPELDPDDDDADIEAIGRFLQSLPPIAGGAPAPYEPTPEDLADMAAWSEDLERRREMLSWYERNPIRSFNADRLD